MKKIIYITIGSLALWFSSCDTPVEDIREATYKSNIGVINADGTNLRYLTSGKDFVYYANFLPNGEKIVYALAGNLNPSLFTINPDGSNKTPINVASNFPFSTGGSETMPRIRITKDSKTIIFAPIADEDASSDIFRVNVDGTHLLNITNRQDFLTSFGAYALSSDDQHVTYCEYHRDTTRPTDLYICASDGSNKRIVKRSYGTKLVYPQFLPGDNNTIIYLEVKAFLEYNIMKLSLADTAQATFVATIPPPRQYPAIIHSSKLLFHRSDYPNNGVYTVDLFTGAIAPVIVSFPSYFVQKSSDELLFSWWMHSERFGIMHSDGTGIKTFSGAAEEQYILDPSISPSNQQIIFRSITLSED